MATSQGRSESRDVFSRGEKWLGPSPTVDYSSWKSREDEVLGFTSFVQEPVAWASQGFCPVWTRNRTVDSLAFEYCLE